MGQPQGLSARGKDGPSERPLRPSIEASGGELLAGLGLRQERESNLSECSFLSKEELGC